MTQICVSKFAIIGSDNGWSPIRRQAIIWTNAGILLIRTLGTNFSEILIQIHTFSNKKMNLKMSSWKSRLFCVGLNVLTLQHIKIFCRRSCWYDVSMINCHQAQCLENEKINSFNFLVIYIKVQFYPRYIFINGVKYYMLCFSTFSDNLFMANHSYTFDSAIIAIWYISKEITTVGNIIHVNQK